MGRRPTLQYDVFEIMSLEGIQSAGSIFSKFQKNKSKFKHGDKDPIRQKLVSMSNPESKLIELVWKKHGPGQYEKFYAPTTEGFIWFINKFGKNFDKFWELIFYLCDYYYQFEFETRIKSDAQYPSKFGNQTIIGKPNTRAKGFDFDKIITYYEKKFLEARTDSFLPKNVKETFQKFENIKEFKDEFTKKINEIPGYKRLEADKIYEIMYYILLTLAEKGKMDKKIIIKKFKEKNHEPWEYDHIISHMYYSGLLLHWWGKHGYKVGLSQFGLLLVFWYLVNSIFEMKYENGLPSLIKLKQYKADLPEIIREIKHIVFLHKELFPKIFNNWPLLTEKILDDDLLQIFAQYYFFKEKFRLFPEKRKKGIDLLQTQQYLEPTYRIELEKFFKIGKYFCQQWIIKEKIKFPIFDNKNFFSINFKVLLEFIELNPKIDISEFEIKNGDSNVIKNLKIEIKRIVNLNSFPDGKFDKIIYDEIDHYIEKTYYMNINDFFLSLINKNEKTIKKILGEIKAHIIDTSKIIRKEKPLNYLLILEKLLTEGSDFFGTNDPGLFFNQKLNKYQMNATANFVSFQFYTDLMSYAPETWKKIMKEDETLKKWYLEKLQEINKIDKLRYDKNLDNQNEIMSILKSLI